MEEIPGTILVMTGDTVTEEVSAPWVGPGTRFQLASVSKSFTAGAILVLAERGLLALDDPIGRWVDGCPPSWSGITLHHLLAHTSGLGHWHDHPRIDLTRRIEPAELIAEFAAVPPLSAPGERWYYSSPGYVLLGEAVQRAAGTPYPQALDDLVLKPLGLERTFAGNPGDRTDVATGLGADGRPVPAFELDVVGLGAGDVWSTSRDVIAWLDAVRDGRLLGEPWRTLMVTAHAGTVGRPNGDRYGYGWFLGTHAGEPWIQHAGDNAGFRSFAALLPESDRRLVILTNSESIGATELSALVDAAIPGTVAEAGPDSAR